ncbi:MAG: D-alanine--D-alanine ligase family protein [Actinomycetales bacterium]
MSQDTTPVRPTVAVLFGGRSSEHAISCVTAAGVLGAIDRTAYDVLPIGVSRDGVWVRAADDPERWQIHGETLPEVTVGADDAPVVLAHSRAGGELVELRPGEAAEVLSGVDVVFPLLHGPYGEDGTIQGMLELTDTRYVGAGVLSSALSMDKAMMKAVLAASGLPIGPHTVILPAQWEQDRALCLDSVASLGFPVFVKPARAGSSMGITRVGAPEDVERAVEAARVHDPKVVVEAAIEGREIECGVLQDLAGGAPIASLPGEIEVTGGHDFYDFEAKYLDEGNVRLSCPADLPDEVTERVQDLARRTFVAMGCEGLARVDVFVTRDWSVVVNELNTMPGFTPFSMFPRMWAASGMSYPQLVDHLIQLALTRPVGLR